MDHFQSGAPIIDGEQSGNVHVTSGEDTEIVGQIKELLDSRVRPALPKMEEILLFTGSSVGLYIYKCKGPARAVLLNNDPEDGD